MMVRHFGGEQRWCREGLLANGVGDPCEPAGTMAVMWESGVAVDQNSRWLLEMQGWRLGTGSVDCGGGGGVSGGM